jgi:hypothetical protein
MKNSIADLCSLLIVLIAVYAMSLAFPHQMFWR